MLGKFPGLRQHAPTFQVGGNSGVFFRRLRAMVDKGRLERLHRQLRPALPGAYLSQLFHPLGIVIGALIKRGVIARCFIEA